jgi:hypothetical protein
MPGSAASHDTIVSIVHAMLALITWKKNHQHHMGQGTTGQGPTGLPRHQGSEPGALALAPRGSQRSLAALASFSLFSFFYLFLLNK